MREQLRHATSTLRRFSSLTRFPANESPRRTGLHLYISAKSRFYLPAFEISRSCRTASGDLKYREVKTKNWILPKEINANRFF